MTSTDPRWQAETALRGHKAIFPERYTKWGDSLGKAAVCRDEQPSVFIGDPKPGVWIPVDGA